MTARWRPEHHDPLLISLHGHGLTDHDITGRMLDLGHAISHKDVGAARRRLGLQAHTLTPMGSREQQPKVKERPNPLAEAKVWLGKRLVEKHGPNGAEYRLDGIPTNLELIMQAHNRVRVGMGLEQILLNPSWRVK